MLVKSLSKIPTRYPYIYGILYFTIVQVENVKTTFFIWCFVNFSLVGCLIILNVPPYLFNAPENKWSISFCIVITNISLYLKNVWNLSSTIFFNLVSPKYKLIILSPDFIQNLVTTGNLNCLLEISDYFWVYKCNSKWKLVTNKILSKKSYRERLQNTRKFIFHLTRDNRWCVSYLDIYHSVTSNVQRV